MPILAIALAALLASIFVRSGHISAQDFPASIGQIEGDDLQVVTTTPAGVETNAAPTVLASGSDITVRSGRALVELKAGGKISVCGPAHFKVLKSGQSVTLALDYGVVHPSLGSSETFTIYTPTIVATPISIGGGSRDTTVGLSQSGEMCVLTDQGAMRVEPQFYPSQSVIVPQGGAVSLSGGQIESLHPNPSACACDVTRASLERRSPPVSAPAAGATASKTLGNVARPSSAEAAHEAPQPQQQPDASDAPVYTVLMPPLSYDANSPEIPPAPDPQTILLVREIRLRPSVVYHGHVDPEPIQASVPPVPVPIAPMPPLPFDAQQPIASPTLLDRLRTFLRRLTGHSA